MVFKRHLNPVLMTTHDSLLLYFHAEAAARSQMDLELLIQGNGLFLVVTCFAFGIDTIFEQDRLLSGYFQRSQIDCLVACCPIGQSADVPSITVAAGSHDIFTNLSVQDDGFFPNGRDVGDIIQ